jgi:hypothetical protein
VTGPVRLLLYMFDQQPLTIHVLGQIPAGPIAARWNGQPATLAEHDATGFYLAIPKSVVRIETNELALELPPGTLLSRLEFSPRAR